MYLARFRFLGFLPFIAHPPILYGMDYADPFTNSNDAPRRHLQRGCLLAAALLLVALVTVVALWRSGSLGRSEFIFSEEGLRVERSTSNERQCDAVQALRLFAEAQEPFKAKFGSYAFQPEELLGFGDVDGNMGTASSPLMAYHGYYFVFPLEYGAGKVNLKKDFVLVAEPAEYGVTGTSTYAIGPKGIVLEEDMEGVRVTNVSQVDTSWKPTT